MDKNKLRVKLIVVVLIAGLIISLIFLISLSTQRNVYIELLKTRSMDEEKYTYLKSHSAASFLYSLRNYGKEFTSTRVCFTGIEEQNGDTYMVGIPIGSNGKVKYKINKEQLSVIGYLTNRLTLQTAGIEVLSDRSSNLYTKYIDFPGITMLYPEFDIFLVENEVCMMMQNGCY